VVAGVGVGGRAAVVADRDLVGDEDTGAGCDTAGDTRRTGTVLPGTNYRRGAWSEVVYNLCNLI
jgi:hypothetical protein